MKIVYIVGNTDLYGSELHLFDLIKQLNSTNKIKLIAFSNGPLIDLIKKNYSNVEISIIKVTWLNGIFKIFEIRKEITNFDADLVHSHQPIAIFWGSICSKISFNKHISTLHSLPNGNAIEYNGVKRKIVYIFHCLVQFIAEGLSSKNIFITYYSKEKHSYFKNKALVVYNWVSDRFKTFEKIENENDDRIKFLTASSLNKGKGMMELLTRFNEIKTKINYKLTIAGAGDENFMNEMRKFIIDNALQNYVNMVGYQADLSSYYMNADYFVLLTRGETFGLVFAEAMKFGLPVICTNLPQLKEIIPDGNIFVGLKERFDDKNLEKILDNDYKKNMGLINAQRANTAFNLENQISKIITIYQEVIIAD